MQPSLDRGVLMISLDFELIWGTMDRAGVEKFAPACRVEREVVIDRLLEVFTRYNVSATWCILGHLFLDRCRAAGGIKHAELARPTHEWVEADWFHNDPATDEATDPLFYGKSLVQKIANAPVKQEIGSHSFSHVIFGDKGCSPAVADSEVRACVEIASRQGFEPLRSFAFPRNRVGHREILKKHGFATYRGPEPSRYAQLPRGIMRALNFVDVITAAAPPVVMPQRDELGLWDIPGSMIYFPMHGVRAAIPVSRRVSRAVKGLNRAADEKKIFHLWFHPTNLADHTDALFDGLEQILKHAKKLEGEGRLRVAPMGTIAAEFQEASLR